jgi:hypothetical protein
MPPRPVPKVCSRSVNVAELITALLCVKKVDCWRAKKSKRRALRVAPVRWGGIGFARRKKHGQRAGRCGKRRAWRQATAKHSQVGQGATLAVMLPR